MKIITKKMLIGDIIENYPQLGETLINDYGFHCVGCMGAAMETLEDGALAHGMTGKEVNSLVKSLNEAVK